MWRFWLAASLHFLLAPFALNATLDYPNFNDNPLLTDRIQSSIVPFLLPVDHPIKATLDAIFSQSRAIESERALIDAGFTIVAGPMPMSFIVVARHPAVPGYVFKLYLDSETRIRKSNNWKSMPYWQWLINRCIQARKIKKIIKQEHIRHFTVADKWLYILPVYPYSFGIHPQPIILVATDMQPESEEVSRQMWKTVVTRKILDELYAILKHGYGGRDVTDLSANVPYTKQGKFVFIDTEKLQIVPKLERATKYFSKDMQRYWEKLIDE